VRGAVHVVVNTTLTLDGARQLADRLLAGAAAADAL